MAIYLNGTLIAQINKVFFNGTQLSSTGKVYGNGTQVWTGGTLTLMEQVFNASGTFTVPSNAINNTFYVGCTGGGGGGYEESDYGRDYGGGGSGRVSATVTLAAGTQVAVSVGAGGVQNTGGTSSFGSYVSCAGGKTSISWGGAGVSGGGNGGSIPQYPSTASSCPAMITLQSGAVDNTNKFYTAKSYAGGFTTEHGAGGGGGCYGNGANPRSSGSPNSGAGGSADLVIRGSGGSGKVVIYYYAMV